MNDHGIHHDNTIPVLQCCCFLQHEEAWEKFYNEFTVHMIKGLEQAGGNK